MWKTEKLKSKKSGYAHKYRTKKKDVQKWKSVQIWGKSRPPPGKCLNGCIFAAYYRSVKLICLFGSVQTKTRKALTRGRTDRFATNL